MSGHRRSKRAAACRRALLLLLLAAAAATPARAQEADPFSATVKVDATADTAAKARETARIDGQRRALAALAERLSGGGAAAKLPKLDDKAITDLVASFEVANERMSAVRYVADYTFHFRPAEVPAGAAQRRHRARRRRRQRTPASRQSRWIAAITVSPGLPGGGRRVLWDDPNPWREAWDAAARRRTGAPRLPCRSAMPAISPRSTPTRRAPETPARSPRSPAAMAATRRSSRSRRCAARPASRAGSTSTVRRYRGGQPVDSRIPTR